MTTQNQGTAVTVSDITGVILAGGRSSRLGRDKAAAMLDGEPLVQWVLRALEPDCAAIVVVTAPGQALPALQSDVPMTIVVDEVPYLGPLAGLVAGLQHIRTDWAFVTSCDAPLLQPGLVTLLRELAAGSALVVCPRVGERLQPLTALYRANCLADLAGMFVGGERRLTAAVERLNPLIVEEPALRAIDPRLTSFHNVNTLADLQHLVDASRTGTDT